MEKCILGEKLAKKNGFSWPLDPCFYGFLRIWPNMAKHENFGSKKNFLVNFFYVQNDSKNHFSSVFGAKTV